MSNTRVEQWRGYDIRFVEIDGEWYAILKDICDALNLKTFDVSRRIPSECMERVSVETSVMGSTNNRYAVNHIKNITPGMIGKDISRKRGDNITRSMLVINESGIYEALFASRKLEARKFRQWTTTVLKKLRSHVGLEGYEVMRMTEPEIQDAIDDILDTLFWDDEKKILMQSVTVQGGDVEQVPFE